MERTEVQRIIDEAEKAQRRASDTLEKLDQDTSTPKVTESQVRDLTKACYEMQQQIVNARNKIYHNQQESEFKFRQSGEKRDLEMRRAEEGRGDSMAGRDGDQSNHPFNAFSRIWDTKDNESNQRREATQEADEAYRSMEAEYTKSTTISSEYGAKLEEIGGRLECSGRRLGGWAAKLERRSESSRSNVAWEPESRSEEPIESDDDNVERNSESRNEEPPESDDDGGDDDERNSNRKNEETTENDDDDSGDDIDYSR
ncbi:hypothetical protein LTR84_009768 [Exophiala bonariae]|uniref:t-SNARE coiled-coil homology domain-containing protein n=1 Tax=Exophiala bonariae TaxID=1690606 RepID=A0AAV9NJB9_9EURO|nr:hypothetical protein LTR84_009768 [Exophiala bonariae]